MSNKTKTKTKVAFLIPCKGKPEWAKIDQSILFKNTLSTFSPEREHSYIFFIGYDDDDIFYTNTSHQRAFKSRFPLFEFRFIEFPTDMMKGHLTRMWNILYKNALCDDKYFIEYFYQCGDDILFKTQGWVQDCINILKSHDNVGIAGPKNDHPSLLTQLMVSRVHYHIFDCLFPHTIFNWGCDDWINIVYSPAHLHVLKSHYCENAGGPPRYDTNKYNILALKKRVAEKAKKERIKLDAFLVKKIHIP